MIGWLVRLQLFVFGAFLVAPIGLLALQGPAAPYVYGRSQEAWPGLPDLFAAKSEGRERFATALLDRLVIRRELIRLRNAATWSMLGSIDREKVVSGAPGWLFYKPAFESWACGRHGRLDHGLHRLALLLELAEDHEIPIVFANAPNKASVERAKVTERAALYAECYFAYEARARSRFAELASPRFVDHFEALASQAIANEVYLPTDTHWNRRAGHSALVQLVDRTGLAPLAAGDPAPNTTRKITDLGNQILMVGAPLTNPSYTPASVASDAPPRRIIAIHDSFYQEVPDLLDAMIPGVLRVNVNFPEFRSIDFDAAEHVVIESAERAFLSRLLDHGFFGWHSRVGQWIQGRMTQETERCDWLARESLLDETDSHDLVLEHDGAIAATGPSPRLYAKLPETGNRRTCLVLEMRSDAPVHPRRVARLFLDARSARIAETDRVFEFVHGRTIELRYGRRRDGSSIDRLAFIVPETAAGRRIRIDLQELPSDARLERLATAPLRRRIAPPPHTQAGRDALASPGAATRSRL